MPQGPSPEKRAEYAKRHRAARLELEEYTHGLYHNLIDTDIDPVSAPEDVQRRMRAADACMLRLLRQSAQEQ